MVTSAAERPAAGDAVVDLDGLVPLDVHDLPAAEYQDPDDPLVPSLEQVLHGLLHLLVVRVVPSELGARAEDVLLTAVHVEQLVLLPVGRLLLGCDDATGLGVVRLHGGDHEDLTVARAGVPHDPVLDSHGLERHDQGLVVVVADRGDVGHDVDGASVDAGDGPDVDGVLVGGHGLLLGSDEDEALLGHASLDGVDAAVVDAAVGVVVVGGLVVSQGSGVALFDVHCGCPWCGYGKVRVTKPKEGPTLRPIPLSGAFTQL